MRRQSICSICNSYGRSFSPEQVLQSQICNRSCCVTTLNLQVFGLSSTPAYAFATAVISQHSLKESVFLVRIFEPKELFARILTRFHIVFCFSRSMEHWNSLSCTVHCLAIYQSLVAREEYMSIM